jgi:putative NIF3 family GTP cyclohydrolase 1 type 2
MRAIALFLFVATLNAQITARQVIERIQKEVGVPWRAQTVDTFKGGNPDTRITGIATTFAATTDVLRRASESGKNLIIAHEPTFYNHLDKTDELANDAVVREKQEFIRKQGLVVFRFHDHWHARQPDGVLAGMREALGWEKLRRGKSQALFVMPETTLGRLAADVRDRLRIRTLRVVGNPEMKLTQVGLSPGAAGSRTHIQMLEREDVEVLLIGEAPEWETIEYVRDAVTQGKRKALVLLGHVPSEEAGMQECARWLKTFIKEVPVEFMPAGEAFWRP